MVKTTTPTTRLATGTAVVPEVDADRQMAERLRKWIGRQGLDYPFTEIAKQVGVDEKTVRAIFAEYVAELEKDLRRRLKGAIPGKLNLQLKRERKLLTMRQREPTDFQWLAVSGWQESIPDDLAKPFEIDTWPSNG